ncbi:hypothetical protein BD626DRAFT_583688 [Schizophyllum amplum]|uniref:RING-type E3 ubiquitin transferase n=1 Tax=Schizophyllum amplum TaxID=97359 RepID=A0A550CF47_9AGAR|nr:hypothetical protein BD626DRAFT_583688 [Auriculariopsis ampla]
MSDSESASPTNAARRTGEPAGNDARGPGGDNGSIPAAPAPPRTTPILSPAFPDDEFGPGDPRARSPLRSFLFISGLLFFLNSGTAPPEDFWTARARYQTALAAMRDRSGNFSVWVNNLDTSQTPALPGTSVGNTSDPDSTPTTFWLAERPSILEQLLHTLSLEEAYHPTPLGRPEGVYYSNLTALFRGPVGFWNVTPPESPVNQSSSSHLLNRDTLLHDLPPWHTLAQMFIAGVRRHPLLKELPLPHSNVTANLTDTTTSIDSMTFDSAPTSESAISSASADNVDQEQEVKRWSWHATRRITLSVDDYPIPRYPVLEDESFLSAPLVDIEPVDDKEGQADLHVRDNADLHIRDRRALGGVALLSGTLELRTTSDSSGSLVNGTEHANATENIVVTDEPGTVIEDEERTTTLTFLGLHLVRSGAVYGLAGTGAAPDLRLLPALVPPHAKGAVARLSGETPARGDPSSFDDWSPDYVGGEGIGEGSADGVDLPVLDHTLSGPSSSTDGPDAGHSDEGKEPRVRDLYDRRSGAPRCSFAVFGQVEDAGVPRADLIELEAAIVRPSGAKTIPAPPLRLKGAMISPACGVMGVFGHPGEADWNIEHTGQTDAKGEKDDTRLPYTGLLEGTLVAIVARRITFYAAFAFLAYLAHVVVLQRHVRRLREGGVAALSAHSAFSILPQLALDGISFVGHVTVALVSHGRAGIALLGAAVVCACLAVLEGRLTGLIWEVQRPEREAAAAMAAARRREAAARRAAARQLPTQVQVTTTSVTLSDNGTPLGAAATPARVSAIATPTPAAPAPATPAPESFLRFFWRHVRTDPAARIWLTTFLMLVLTARILISPQVTAVFAFCTHGCMWLPEIYRAFRRGRASALGGLSVVRVGGAVDFGASLGRPAEYIICVTILRAAHLLYFCANDGNVFEIEERSWARPLVVFIALQAGFVILQSWLGPTFFMPGRLVSRSDIYDYHPPLPTDVEAALGDCAICMEAIDVHGHGSMGETREDKTAIGSLRSARKEYSLAPCHHLFHTRCLERWLAIKNICPQCRRPLPPL